MIPVMDRPLAPLVRAFRGLRVLVIGDVMLDTYLEGTASRLCAEGPVPVVHQTAEAQAPGGAGNTAANLRALGADVMLLGVVGADAAGATLRAALHEQGVDDAWLVEDAAGATLHKVRILANDQYVVRFDAGGTSRRLPAACQEELLQRLERAVPHCNCIVVSDYCYGVLHDALIARLATLHAALTLPLVVDSKDLQRFWAVGATLLTPNNQEACLAAGLDAGSDGEPRVPDVERAGHRLLARVDAAAVAVTMAAGGVLLMDRQGSIHLPAHPVARASDVGAGDSFTAATVLALAAGASTSEAVRIGIEAGGVAVTKRRTAVVRQQELLQRVSREEAPASPAVADLAALLTEERARKRTVVFSNGVFDILHAGHVFFLREAKQLGDVLVVAVNSDASARRLKGANRPINSERDRLALVAALGPVDHVILFDEETPEEMIRALRPHIHVKGGDYAGEDLPEAAAVAEIGGQVIILPLLESVSTSQVLDRIVRLLA